MSMSLHVRKALVLSPSASHPQDYGNRNRVFQTTSWLKNAGFEIHFVLYPYEDDWVSGVPDSAAEMRAAWDSFTVIPPSLTLHAPPRGSHHEIDEWWDPQIGIWLKWLFARERFDIFVVNYTFFSKAFEFAPEAVIKILETHDIFSGRKELFLAHGAKPEFFYTTPDQEKVALDRADIVVAIKDGEADHLRALTAREVVSVPFNVVERRVAHRPERLEINSPLKVGFIGARNTVNALNMARFLKRFAKFEQIYVPPPIEIVIAGNVCSNLSVPCASVELIGYVPSVEDYYQSIDLIVAPMSFSTGIKIKIGEALSFGKPVVATRNGFDGFPSTDAFHELDGVDAVCRALMNLAFDRERLTVLEQHSALAARLAARRSTTGYEALSRAIRRLSKAIVFVTNQPLWKAETLEQERLAQWAEYCSFLAHVVIIYTGEGALAPLTRDDKQLARNSTFVDAKGQPDIALAAILDLARTCALFDIVISADNGTGSAIWHALHGTADAITLDTWVPELAQIAGSGTSRLDADMWIAGKRQTAGASQALSTTALRYLPESLRSWLAPERSSDILTVFCDPGEPDMRGLDLLEAITGRCHVASMSDGQCVSGENISLRALGECRRPGLLLALGRNQNAAEACRSIAACAEIPFLHLSSDSLPMAFAARDGKIALCTSFADVAEFLPELRARESTGETEHPRDTGWSSYRHRLSH